MKNKKNAFVLLVAIMLTFGLSVSVQSLLAQWTAPGSTAPYGNVGVPVYSGSTNEQTIEGGLIINNASGASDGLTVNGATQNITMFDGTVHAVEVCDETGANCKDVSEEWGGGLWEEDGTNIYYNSGMVGVGTDSPSAAMLHVMGGTHGIYSSGSDYGIYGVDSDDAGAAYVGYGGYGFYTTSPSNLDDDVDVGGNLTVDGRVCSGFTCIDGGWRLLAKSRSPDDEESRVRLYPSGNKYIYQLGNDHTYNVVNSGWDSDMVMKEILFVTKNYSDHYCVGVGTLDLAYGNNGNVSCRNCVLDQGGNIEDCAHPVNEPDWISLFVNGVRASGCPQNNFTSGSSYNGARFGLQSNGLNCLYSVDDTVSNLTVDQADWSPGSGNWEWEIYYR